MTAEIVPGHGLSLPVLAERINAETTAAERDARSAMDHALAAGMLLIDAKATVPHGEWEPWLLANCEVKPRTARAYMQLVTRLPALPEPERQRVADLPLREAVRAISTPASGPPSQPAARARDRGQCVRAAEVLRKCSTAARDSAKRIELMQGDHGYTMLSGRQVAALRTKLTDALQALNSLVSDDGGHD